MLYQVRLAWAGFELTIIVVIDTNYIGSYNSNYYTLTTLVHNMTHISIWKQVGFNGVLYLILGAFYKNKW
jgi:hypothetical protein